MPCMQKRSFDELVQLMTTLRGANGCPWDRKQSLGSLKPFIVEEAYEVVDPRTRQRTDRVFFGATVTLEDEDGVVTTYQIVGGDELDDSLGPGRISYEAPLGRALLGKREGDAVVVRRPAGEVELTIVKVDWK